MEMHTPQRAVRFPYYNLSEVYAGGDEYRTVAHTMMKSDNPRNTGTPSYNIASVTDTLIDRFTK